MSARHHGIARRCARCSKEVQHGRQSHSPVAHKCPHGSPCRALNGARAECVHCQLEPQLAGLQAAGAAFRKVFGDG